MSERAGFTPGMSLIIKRALEGRISPLSFLLILGFFSSLVLLYISLHVHFFTISQDISKDSERLGALMDSNVRLMARYNELISADRIIPMVEELGFRAGTPDEMKRLALYEDKKLRKKKYHEWAQAGTAGAAAPTIPPEGR